MKAKVIVSGKDINVEYIKYSDFNELMETLWWDSLLYLAIL